MTNTDDRRLDRSLDRLQGRLPNWIARPVGGLRNPDARWIRIPVGILFILGGLRGLPAHPGLLDGSPGPPAAGPGCPVPAPPDGGIHDLGGAALVRMAAETPPEPSRMMAPGRVLSCNFNSPAVPLTGPDRAVNPLRANRRRHAQDGRKPSIKVRTGKRPLDEQVRPEFDRSRLPSRLAGAGPSFAETPKDSLVMAWQFDDIISLDPAEIFEVSGAEYGAQVYDRLIGIDLKDTSKIVPAVAESWTVSDDGKTYTFKIRDGVKFHSGNPLTAEDAAYSLQRAVKLNKSPALHPDAVRLHQGQCRSEDQGDRRPDAGDRDRQGLCADLRAELPDRRCRLRGRCQAAEAEREGRRLRLWLAEDQFRRIGRLQAAAVEGQRDC